jgi:hypothetical protein
MGCAGAGGTLAVGAGGSTACVALGAIGARSVGEGSASKARFGTCFAKPMSRVSQRPTGWPGSCSPPGAREPSPRVSSVSGRGTPWSASAFDGVAPGSDGIANVEDEAWNVDGSDCDASCSSSDSGREGSGARPGCWLGSAGVFALGVLVPAAGEGTDTAAVGTGAGAGDGAEGSPLPAWASHPSPVSPASGWFRVAADWQTTRTASRMELRSEAGSRTTVPTPRPPTRVPAGRSHPAASIQVSVARATRAGAWPTWPLAPIRRAR